MYHKTKLGIEKSMQSYNCYKKMYENTNKKILTEEIQENGKLEKNWKKIRQFSSNFCLNSNCGTSTEKGDSLVPGQLFGCSRILIPPFKVKFIYTCTITL